MSVKKWVKKLAKIHVISWLGGLVGTAIIGHAYAEHKKTLPKK